MCTEPGCPSLREIVANEAIEPNDVLRVFGVCQLLVPKECWRMPKNSPHEPKGCNEREAVVSRLVLRECLPASCSGRRLVKNAEEWISQKELTCTRTERFLFMCRILKNAEERWRRSPREIMRKASHSISECQRMLKNAALSWQASHCTIRLF